MCSSKHVTGSRRGAAPGILNKFYDDLVPDLPRMPYVDEASARATVEAMQLQGPPLPRVDVKALFDNKLIEGYRSRRFPG
jgi:hypothetical protein